jgi:hypothetical protein
MSADKRIIRHMHRAGYTWYPDGQPPRWSDRIHARGELIRLSARYGRSADVAAAVCIVAALVAVLFAVWPLLSR